MHNLIYGSAGIICLECSDHTLVEWLYEEDSVVGKKHHLQSLHRILMRDWMSRSIVKDKQNLEL